MRDIKFRAWNKTEKHMYNWSNLLNQNLKNIFTIPEQCGYNLMQYTGLKDKNGEEIFEGDIVKVKLYKGEEEKYFIGKVEYFGSNFIVDADNNSEYHVYDLDGFGIDYRYNLEDCEVIGNIYDNPELLEEGK